MGVKILKGDCRDVLKTLPSESVHCVVTSPPYWGLRDYQTATWEGGDAECDHVAPNGQGASGQRANRTFTANAPYKTVCRCGARRIDSQIGLEPTFDAFIAEMVSVFREVRRVLRKDGTCWVNMGDSYAGGGRGGGDPTIGERNLGGSKYAKAVISDGLKPKDLCGIPWRVAFALQADGWWLRQDIIWAKPNPMPESVTDRCTKAHEYLFLLSKSARYWYDAEAIREEGEGYGRGTGPGAFRSEKYQNNRSYDNSVDAPDSGTHGHSFEGGRNKRSVWEVATAPFSEAHFATFPPELIEPCIKAGCPDKCCPHCGKGWERVIEEGDRQRIPRYPQDDRIRDSKMHGPFSWKTYETKGWRPSCKCSEHQPTRGTVLDPFGGAGTTGLVADRLQRNAILIELNPQYAAMAEKRLFNDAPLFAQVAAE